MIRYQECLNLKWDRQDLENVSWSLAELAVLAATERQADRQVR
jgi:hypothetical protein